MLACSRKIAAYNRKIAAYNRSIAAYTCKITAYRRNIAAYTCNIAAYTCKITAYRRNIATYRRKNLKENLKKWVECPGKPAVWVLQNCKTGVRPSICAILGDSLIPERDE